MGEQSRTNILVVDDDISMLECLKRALGESKWYVEVASDGPSALAAFKRNSFTLAVIDLGLPGMSGSELFAAITQQWSDTAVLMMGEAADTAAALGCMQAGAYDFLIKPPNENELILRAERALERRRLIQEERQYSAEIQVRVQQEAQATRRLFLAAIESLSSALEAKDDYTRGHSERVSRLGEQIARTIGARDEEIKRISLAGRLHDIGKIGVRENVLSKPGKLSEEEYLHIQTHPIIGERILATVLMDVETVGMVRNHHEHYSGGGYPDGLRGSAIPLGARVLAVADAYDALTSDRPYRSRLDRKSAIGVLRSGAGAQWQPAIVEALVLHLDAGNNLRADR